MSNTVELGDPEALGAAIRGRMTELQLRNKHVMQRAHGCDETFSERWFSSVKTGKPGARDVYQLACLARVLDWPADALERIAAGEDPDSIEDVPWEPGTEDVSDRVDRLEDKMSSMNDRVDAIGKRIGELTQLVERSLEGGPVDDR